MRVFLDSSVLIAASASAEGASREVFRRVSTRHWQLITTPYAVAEVTRNLDTPRGVSQMPIKEHDSVVLSRPLPEHGLQIGDVGAVVFVHRNNEAYEVEFIAGDGNTVGVVTLKPEDIRRLDASEILHARRISA